MLTNQAICAPDMTLIPTAELNDLHTRIAELTREARTDPLTGLGNRTALFEQMQQRATTTGPGAVALFDLDRFKDINDTLGHEAGDQVLITTANRLRHAAGPAAYIARLGGDEFVILFACDGTTALTAAEYCAAAVRQPQDYGPRRIFMGASAGVADLTADRTPEQLLRRADSALYTAKQTRGRAVAWNPDSTDTLDHPLPGRRQARDADTVGWTALTPQWQ